ncbi:MAG: hypothetical protein AAFO97_15070 [Pseudomonadota bacterium]
MRTDAQSMHGNWADGILTHILDVDVSAQDVTPDGLYRVIMVTTAGNVAVTQHDGTTEILPALQPGVPYPFSPAAILNAGTTATGIKLLR